MFNSTSDKDVLPNLIVGLYGIVDVEDDLCAFRLQVDPGLWKEQFAADLNTDLQVTNRVRGCFRSRREMFSIKS